MNMKRIGFQAHNMWWQPIRSPEYLYDKQDSLCSTTTPEQKKGKIYKLFACFNHKHDFDSPEAASTKYIHT